MIIHSEQINELAAALSEAQGQMPVIAKDKVGKVKGQTKDGRSFDYSYKYADISDVLKSVLPVLSKNGLCVLQPTSVDQSGVWVHTRLVHKSGQWMESIYPVGGVGGDHQKMGGALTYARRYALSSMIGVAADEDVDGEGAETIPERRSEPPRPRQADDNPFADHPDAPANMAAIEYIAKAESTIAATDDAQELGAWWNSDREKDARRTAKLTSDQVEHCKRLVVARMGDLKRKAA